MKVYKNIQIIGWTGEPIGITRNGKVEEAKLVDHLGLILANAPFQTQMDSKEGMLLAVALRDAEDKDSINIEESTHTWLKKVAEQVTPAIYRTNGGIVYEVIKEGFEKIHQSAEEKKKEEE